MVVLIWEEVDPNLNEVVSIEAYSLREVVLSIIIFFICQRQRLQKLLLQVPFKVVIGQPNYYLI